jgi:hypothetical protein
MKTLLAAAVIGALALVPGPRLAAQGPAPAATPCDQVTGLTLVCGQQGPEDLYATADGKWVLTGVFGGSGGINGIRVSDRTSTRVYPSTAAKKAFDAKAYPGCPGPPDATPAAKFTTHGLWLEPGTASPRRLFVVGHGDRESIEIFTVDTRSATPVLTWIGCAIAPDPIGLNSVRGLPDGGFIASNFLARGATAQQMMTGAKNGELWEWHAASGWQKVPGSEAAGANGLEMSDDGKTLYVAAWGSQSFFRLSRGRTPVERQEIPLGFRVDNLHRSRDGSLLAAGQGQGASEIVRIDPKTMAVTKVLHLPDTPSFRGGTVAVDVGNRLWVGSFAGDRIAVLAP